MTLMPLTASEAIWDRRFRIRADLKAGFAIAALGGRLRARGRSHQSHQIDSAIPALVRPTLPALWRADELIAVPHLRLGAMSDLSIEILHPKPVLC